MLLLLALLACDNGKDTGGNDADDFDTGDTAVDTGDSGDTGDTDPGNPGDVQGPDLPACTPQAGDGDLVALSGVVLGIDGPEAGYVVYSRAAGTISCVGPDCDTTGAEVVCTEGVVSAGLVDAHNHLQYNTMPRWEVDPTFEDRYDWQGDDRYDEYRTAYDAIKDSYVCEIMKWAEARELVHGTTAAVGSSGGSCIEVLVRNLDEDAGAHGIDGYSIVYSASRVTGYDDNDADDYNADLASGAEDAILMHVAEGWNGSVTDEIDHMFDLGMVGPGQAYVHSADATLAQLAQMGADGTAIVWSPRSNLALYNTTTPVQLAEKLGVPWAIGTDWTPSGSMAPTRELACAADWLAGKGDPLSDVQLYGKATTDAARIVGLDGVLGALAPGYRADIAVFAWDRTPYRQIIESGAEDVRLTVVGGKALYGTTDMIATLAENPDWCDALDVCGESRSICVKAGESGDDAQTLADVEATLESAMSGVSMPSGYEYAGELYPIFACDDEPGVCDLRQPADGDDDGDGVADDGDLCVGLYDPQQGDGDGDGVGDDCDPCPLTADVTDCPTSPGDVDGDGIPNEDDLCPYAADPGQEDADGDRIGDACDACPDESNADGAGCTISTRALRDPADPDHPAEGTVVRISGLVVTGVNDAHGFFVQDPTATEYGGFYVYDYGDNAVAVGDEVTVDGSYLEYYDQTELTEPVVTVTGTVDVPAPQVVAACDVATGGALAEPLEGMLVRVEAVEVTNANPDDPSDYDEFEVAGCLRVDDFLYDALDQPALGTTYAALIGPVTYSFSNSKIVPRDDADLVP